MRRSRVSLLARPRLKVARSERLFEVAVVDGNGKFTLQVHIAHLFIRKYGLARAVVMSLHLDLVSHGRFQVLLGAKGTDRNVRALISLCKAG